jgi:formylglycine-generating enzyme required for sulfatase activity
MLTKQFNELNRQADVVTTRVNVADLKQGYSVFGNKGNVWNNTAHIAKSDFSGRTLCGVPMLSSNWARIEQVDTIGCSECLARYKDQ